MAKLIIKEGDRKRIYDICEDTLHVGSTPENNIRLRDASVSRVHCEIKKTPQGYKIIDLESKRGTKVNGEFINQHTLKHGDRIVIGKALIQFHAGGAAARARVDQRDSMRMETARSRKGMHPAAIIGISLGVVAILSFVIWKVIESQTQLEGIIVLDKAAFMLKSTEVEKIKKGVAYLDDYDDLPARERNTYSDKKYKRLRKKAEVRWQTIKDTAEFEAEEKDYFRYSNKAMPYAQDGRYDEAIRLLDAFMKKYPDSRYNRTMLVKKRRWMKKLGAEMGSVPSTLAAIRKNIEEERYAKAKALLETASRQWRKPEHIEQLNKLYKLHGDTMADAWKLRHREAQEYADEANFKFAKDIYNDVIKKWGIPKYAKLAKTELEKLKLREG